MSTQDKRNHSKMKLTNWRWSQMFRSKENSSISNMSQVIRKKKASTILIFLCWLSRDSRYICYITLEWCRMPQLSMISHKYPRISNFTHLLFFSISKKKKRVFKWTQLHINIANKVNLLPCHTLYQRLLIVAWPGICKSILPILLSVLSM